MRLAMKNTKNTTTTEAMDIPICIRNILRLKGPEAPLFLNRNKNKNSTTISAKIIKVAHI